MNRSPGYTQFRIEINSLAFRVMCWFAGHLDEELSSKDISIKFGVEADDVPTRLHPLARLNVLDRRRSGAGGQYYWRAGAVLIGCIRR